MNKNRNLFIAFLIALALGGCAVVITPESAHGAEITKGDIIKTVQHMEDLSKQQKTMLDKAQGDYKKVEGEREWWRADDQVHITGESFWRKRAQVILYALALAFGWWFYGEAKKLCVSPVSGWIGLVIPFAAALLGAAIGYAFGLYVLGWIAQFLP